MKVSVAQVGPPAVALAVVGLCAWPYLGPSAKEEAAEAEKLPEIAAPLLAPKLGRPPTRDPFKAPGEPQPDMLALANLKPSGAPARGPAKAAAGAAAGPRREPTAAAAPTAPGPGPRTKPDGAETPKPARDEDGEPPSLGGLILNATIVQPYRRFAMIDGKVYAEGDVLRVPGVGPARLLRIEHNRALFVARGKPAELTFRAAPSRPAAGGGAPGPASNIAAGPRPTTLDRPGPGAGGDMAAILLRVLQQQASAPDSAADALGGVLP
ncbi:MAG TPA: hypothetical protein VG406_15100 [Isosphaeraceae bacterium]|jgi:hypothetical protein|nr:hypothetical protein [Isosphaeraceae bacterium]